MNMETMDMLRSEQARFRLATDKHARHKPWFVEDLRRITVVDLQACGHWDLLRLGFANWDGTMMLLPLWALGLMAPGERLNSIMGDSAVVGQDEIDTDARGGCIAYGFEHPGLKELKRAAT